MKYLIWSLEHRAWWNPGALGYTTDRDKAGRFGWLEAADVVANANLSLATDHPPNEAIVPIWEE